MNKSSRQAHAGLDTRSELADFVSLELQRQSQLIDEHRKRTDTIHDLFAKGLITKERGLARIEAAEHRKASWEADWPYSIPQLIELLDDPRIVYPRWWTATDVNNGQRLRLSQLATMPLPNDTFPFSLNRSQ